MDGGSSINSLQGTAAQRPRPRTFGDNMKTPCLFIALLLAAPLWAANEHSPSNTPASVSSTFVITQVEAKVLKAFVARDGNAVFKAYLVKWKDQEVVISDMMARSDLKEGDTIKFVVKTLPFHKHGANSDVLMFMIAPDVAVPVYKPVPRVVQSQTTFVFFECRGNELFYVDKDALSAEFAKMRGAAQQAGAPQANVVGNYTIDPISTTLGVMRLKPRDGVQGQAVADLANPTGQYQTVLKERDPKRSMIVFFQRDDSAEVARQAQQLAETAGFTTEVQPLAKDKAIMFGR